jgi:hypothetical protein
MYKINDKVFVCKTNEFKTIIDSEMVGDVELYYMSDKTAYPVDELVSLTSCEDTILNMELNIEDLLVDVED